MKRRICVSVGKEDVQDCLDAARFVAERADVIEIRLDLMRAPEVSFFLENIDTPLLFTNRAEWEGGRFIGEEKTRIKLLIEAAAGGAAYIDLELLAPKHSWTQLRKATSDSVTQLISSWHNFNSTPSTSELEEKLKMMQESGADVGKIVTMAHDFRDVLRVLNLQENAAQMNFPLIAFCMGSVGVVSRVATVALGGYMTYCALDEGEATAPGQVTYAALNGILELMGR